MIIAIKCVNGVDDHLAEVTRLPEGVWMNGVKHRLVATGDVEWHDDNPVEVYVPEARLADWRETHPL